MRNIGFILVYVDDVAASVAFYASLLGRPAVEFVPHLRDASRRPGPGAGSLEARRGEARRLRGRRRRDRFSCGKPCGSRCSLRRMARARSRESRSSRLRWISATPSSPSIRTASASAFSRRRRTERRAGGGRFVGKAGNNAFACVNQKCRLCSTSIGELADPGPRGRSIRRRDKSAGEKNDLNCS